MFKYISEGAFFLSLRDTPRQWRLLCATIRLRTDNVPERCPVSSVLGGTMGGAWVTGTAFGFSYEFINDVINAADARVPFEPETRFALLAACDRGPFPEPEGQHE